MLSPSDIVLGLSYGTHDSAACLVRGGCVVAAAEEERFNREKRTMAFPINAIEYCLKEGQVAEGSGINLALSLSPRQYLGGVSRLIVSAKPRNSLCQQLHSYLANLGRVLRCAKALPRFKVHTRFYNHHLSHAAGAFFSSGFSEAAILVIDGIGETDTITAFEGAGTQLRLVLRQRFPNSLGKLYGAVCRYLGFWGHSKEGEVMGLASFGDGEYAEALSRLILWESQLPRIDMRFFHFGLTPLQPSCVSDRFLAVFGPPRRAGEPVTTRHKNIAKSIQLVLEDAVLRMLSGLMRTIQIKKLCFSGGVALNCKLNQRLVESELFDSVFVPPVPHDAGLALGASYLASIDGGIVPQPLASPYLGPCYDDENIRRVIEAYGVRWIETENPELAAAQLLAKGEIIGWFQGKAEFGPRALGNRSILADPRRAEVKDRINICIKGRATFRPFAPAVVAESAREVFECSVEHPYMSATVRVRPEWHRVIPAVVHIDHTARVQTVRPDQNPRFYRVIKIFESLTGVPVVLNTSLNGRGEPIANTPEDALRLLINTSLGALIIGPYVCQKR